MIGGVGGSYRAARGITEVPTNPLWRILYESGRPLGFVAGAAGELVERARYPEQPRDPILQSAIEGWRKVKTFDEVIADPWLAFAMNVGFDPITWIPSGMLWRGAKLPAQATGRLARAVGLTKAPPVIRAFDTLKQMRDFLGRHFVVGYGVGRFDDPTGSLKTINMEKVDLFRELEAKLSIDVSHALALYAKNDDELEELIHLVELTPLGKNLAESFAGVPAEVIVRFKSLSDGGKLGYRFALEVAKEHEALLASQLLMSDARMAGFLAKTGTYRVSHLMGGWSDMVRNLNLDEAVMKIGKREAKAKDLIQFSDRIPPDFRPLGELTISAPDYGAFQRNIAASARDDPARLLIKQIGYDQELRTLHRARRALASKLKSQGKARGLWSHEMYLEMLRNPKGSLVRAMQRVTGRRVRFLEGEADRYWVKPKGKIPVTQDPAKAFPTEDAIEAIVNVKPLSPFRSLRHFWRESRKSLEVNRVHLADAVVKGVPPNVFAGKTLEGMREVRKMLDETFDPDLKVWSARALEETEKNEGAVFGLPTAYFQKRRTVPGRVEEIAEKQMGFIEQNLANVFRVEGRETARVIAERRYAGALIKYFMKRGLGITKEQFEDPDAMLEVLDKIRREQGHDVFRIVRQEGFEPVKPKALKGLYLPREVAREVNRAWVAGMTKKQMNGFFRNWKKYQDIWKAHVLAIFPQYHTRNILSNLWNNQLAGMHDNPVNSIRDMQFYRHAWVLQKKFARIPREGIGILTPDERDLYDVLRKKGIIESGEFIGELSDIMNAAGDVKALLNPKKILLNPGEWLPIQYGFKFGRTAENNARIAHFLWARNVKNLGIDDAARSVQKYLFDYRYGLTPFESKYFRNLLMPFYAWTRFNLPLQIEMLAYQPRKFANVYKLKQAWEQAWGGPDPEEEFMANWMKRATGIRWRWNKDKGTYEYFMLDSWLPAADVNKILSIPLFRDAFLGLVSPYAKIPVEILWNWNFFTKKPISEFTDNPFSAKALTGGIMVPNGITLRPFDVKGTEIPLPPGIEHMIRHIRYVNDLDRFLRGYEDQNMPGRLTRLWLGKSYPYDPVKQKVWWQKTIDMRLRSLEWAKKRELRRHNEGKAAQIQKLIDESERIRRFYE